MSADQACILIPLAAEGEGGAMDGSSNSRAGFAVWSPMTSGRCTRWRGAKMEIGFRPSAAPSARDAVALPTGAAFVLDATISESRGMASNLLSNAITHGSDRMPVRIDGAVVEGELNIRVANSRRPIPPEQIDKLFLPFKRGEGRAVSQGLGLGLYIASRIAEAHDARIDVRSDTSETCFTFKMPLKRQSGF